MMKFLIAWIVLDVVLAAVWARHRAREKRRAAAARRLERVCAQ
jgi:hypothetical protein